MSTENDLIKKIEQAVTVAKTDKDWRRGYMMYQMRQRDAELRGEKRGELRGINIGKKEAMLLIAQRMLERKMSPSDITDITGLTPDEIRNLAKEGKVQ